MVNVLRNCLIWRVLVAIGGFIGRTFQSSGFIRGFLRWWNDSGTCRFLVKHLSKDAEWSEDAAISRLALL